MTKHGQRLNTPNGITIETMHDDALRSLIRRFVAGNEPSHVGDAIRIFAQIEERGMTYPVAPNVGISYLSALARGFDLQTLIDDAVRNQWQELNPAERIVVLQKASEKTLNTIVENHLDDLGVQEFHYLLGSEYHAIAGAVYMNGFSPQTREIFERSGVTTHPQKPFINVSNLRLAEPIAVHKCRTIAGVEPDFDFVLTAARDFFPKFSTSRVASQAR